MFKIRVPVWLLQLTLVAFGAIVAVTTSVIVWHLFVIWPHQLPTTKQQSVQGFLIAPADLPDKHHIVNVSVDVVSGDVLTIGRMFTATIGERWQVTLKYRTAMHESKTRTWQFFVACDSETSDYFSLSRVNALNLVTWNGIDEVSLPLATVIIHVPGIENHHPTPLPHLQQKRQLPPNLQMVTLSSRLFIRRDVSLFDAW